MKFGKYDVEEQNHPTGTGVQCLKFFPNGYGASIVRFYIPISSPFGKAGSYGVNEDLWELAVLKGNEKDGWSLTYDTPITDDVIGYLSENEVGNYLERIEYLSMSKIMTLFRKVLCFLGFHKGICYDGAYRCIYCDYTNFYREAAG